MEYKDYYKVMGLARDASQDEIKRAYRKLARKYHPDVSKEPNAELRFKEVGEAYEVLKDPEKRAAYDQLGVDWHSGQEFHPPPNWDSGFEFRGGGFSDGRMGGFSDFFEELFGRQGSDQFRYRGQVNARGEDHHAKVEVDLEDAFYGTTRSISLQRPEVDDQGKMHMVHRTLNVKIPKGVKQGQLIRLTGQGSPGSGKGSGGDLFLEINFKPHRIYKVDGRDLFLELPITPWEAALGATVKTPTPSGFVDLKVPARSSSGGKLRLKGRGIPGNPPGDLYITLNIVLPRADTEQAISIYKEMEKKLAFNPRVNFGA